MCAPPACPLRAAGPQPAPRSRADGGHAARAQSSACAACCASACRARTRCGARCCRCGWRSRSWRRHRRRSRRCTPSCSKRARPRRLVQPPAPARAPVPAGSPACWRAAALSSLSASRTPSLRHQVGAPASRRARRSAALTGRGRAQVPAGAHAERGGGRAGRGGAGGGPSAHRVHRARLPALLLLRRHGARRCAAPRGAPRRAAPPCGARTEAARLPALERSSYAARCARRSAARRGRCSAQALPEERARPPLPKRAGHGLLRARCAWRGPAGGVARGLTGPV